MVMPDIGLLAGYLFQEGTKGQEASDIRYDRCEVEGRRPLIGRGTEPGAD